MEKLLELIVTGISVGAIYGLVAMGFVFIYKATSVVNFALGQLVLLGAYFCWTCLVQWELPVAVSFILTFAVVGGLGIVVERIMLRPMIGQPVFSMIMLTLALFYFLQGGITAIWGGKYQSMPEFIPKDPLELGSILLPQQYIWTFIAAIVLVTIFVVFFKYAKSGLFMRATAEDHQIAESMGIKVTQVFSQSWFICGVIAALSGILLGSLNVVSEDLINVGFKAIPVALLGGLESIYGAIIAGLIVGISENLAAGYLDPYVGGGIATIFAYVILIFVLVIRPYGLFGLKEIERI